MKFAPVKITGGPTDGQNILFSIWETRRMDYEAFAKENPGVNELWKRGKVNEPLHPVVSVNWDDANAFCVWLTRKERAEGKIGPKDEYRLPTDHEWSCAVGIGSREDLAASPADKAENCLTTRGARTGPLRLELGIFLPLKSRDMAIPTRQQLQ